MSGITFYGFVTYEQHQWAYENGVTDTEPTEEIYDGSMTGRTTQWGEDS